MSAVLTISLKGMNIVQEGVGSKSIYIAFHTVVMILTPAFQSREMR